MQKVILNGELSKFGAEWNVSCKTGADIFKLIMCQKPEFKKYLLECEEAGLDLEIVRGNRVLKREEELFMSLNPSDSIIVTLCPSGGKSKWVKIVVGVTLMVLSGIPPDPTWFTKLVYAAGLQMTIAGINEVLASGPESEVKKNEGQELADELFNGPTNVAKQGIPVPVLYGELIVGGATIGVDFNQIGPDSPGTESPIVGPSLFSPMDGVIELSR